MFNIQLYALVAGRHVDSSIAFPSARHRCSNTTEHRNL